MSADDHRRTALDTLECEQARHVLTRLLQDYPDLRLDAERLAAELLQLLGLKAAL